MKPGFLKKRFKNPTKDQKKDDLETQLYKGCWIALPLLVLLGYLYEKVWIRIWRFPCLMDSLLGLYCPGCGGTRAVRALLKGELLQALWMHPLVPFAALLFCGFFLTQTLEKLKVPGIKGWRFHGWYLYASLGLVITNFLVKNILRLCFSVTL